MRTATIVSIACLNTYAYYGERVDEDKVRVKLESMVLTSDDEVVTQARVKFKIRRIEQRAKR